MDWLERLNRLPGRIPLPDGRSDSFFAPGTSKGAPGNGDLVIEVKHWAYSAHLPDNVPHRHTYYEVCLVGGHGAGWYVVQGHRHPIAPGDLFFSRPGVLHQIVNAEGVPNMELFWVAFDARLPDAEEEGGGLAALFRRFAGAAEVLVVPDEGGSLRAAWDALRASAGRATVHPAAFAVQSRALIGALIVGIAEAGGGAADADAPVEKEAAAFLPGDEAAGRRAVRYIHDNLGRPLSVPEIAERVGVSPRHLTRLFARFAGTSPAAYVETARIQRASTLLLRTDDPIKQIGALVGYEDVHHFTRVFTRAIGCPPGLFRRTRGASARPIPQGPDIREPGTLV